MEAKTNAHNETRRLADFYGLTNAERFRKEIEAKARIFRNYREAKKAFRRVGSLPGEQN